MKRIFSILAVLILTAACSQAAPETVIPTAAAGTLAPTEAYAPYVRDLAILIDEIELMGVHDPDVLRAMAAVPRHEFVPAGIPGPGV